MRKRLINPEYNIWEFLLTDREAVRRIHDCISSTNPELGRDDIRRNVVGNGYVASYRRSDGEDVKMAIDNINLKRYFGARCVALTKDGLRVVRRVPK